MLVATSYFIKAQFRAQRVYTYMDNLFKTAKEAALNAAQIITSARKSHNFRIKTKTSSRDLVTDVDMAADEAIIETILSEYPEHQILSEESYKQQTFDFNRPLWIIDPIDGTQNFVHGHVHVGVSIAYLNNFNVELGIVHAPFLNEVFTAVKGHGAYLNEDVIQVDSEASIADSLIATGFPTTRSDLNLMEKITARVKGTLLSARDLRRNGACSLDLCWTACGRLGGYFESTIKPWDMAAGSLIIKEAGGMVGTLDHKVLEDKKLYYLAKLSTEVPKDLYSTDLVAGSKRVYGELLKVLQAS